MEITEALLSAMGFECLGEKCWRRNAWPHLSVKLCGPPAHDPSRGHFWQAEYAKASGVRILHELKGPGDLLAAVASQHYDDGLLFGREEARKQMRVALGLEDEP